MKRARLAAFSLAIGAAATPALAAEGTNDRLTFMIQGATLTGTNGGYAGSLGWLHNFSADTVLGIAGDFQRIGDARWKFGSLSLSHGFGQAGKRTNLYFGGHQGTGEDRTHDYDYAIYEAGIIQNITRQLSVQIEDKEIDVDTVHGNLPKIGVQYLWSPALMTSVSYSHSVSGNLGTRIGTIRIDAYGKSTSLAFGIAGGETSPIFINLTTTEPQDLKQAFVGVTWPRKRGDFSLLADYQNLEESDRFTLSFNCTLNLRASR